MQGAFDAAVHSTLDRDQIGEALLRHFWTFAKTMPQWPHEYVVRKNWQGPIPWENVVVYMREHGVNGWFLGNRKPLRYFRIGGKRYWTMGYGPEITTIINRADDVQVPYLRLEGVEW